MNDPVNYIDPLGLITWGDVAGHAGRGVITGVVVGGAVGFFGTPLTGLGVGLGVAGLVCIGGIADQLFDEAFKK